MNPEEHDDMEEVKILLKKTLALSEENNQMIRSMRNAARLHSLVRILFVIAVIALIITGYYHYKPYIDQAKNTYNSYNETQNKVLDTFNKYIPGNKAQ